MGFIARDMGVAATLGPWVPSVVFEEIRRAVRGYDVPAAVIDTGGGAQTARHYGNRILGKLRGERELTVDDAVLRLLALRQGQLLKALAARGHAAQHTIHLDSPQERSWREDQLPEPLNKARAHPEWSSLNPGGRLGRAERQETIARLAKELG